MRVQILGKKILLICLLFSLSATASVDKTKEKEMRKLFDKYEEVMNQQKVEQVEEVFTKAFLEGHGGKDEFVAKIKTLPYVKPKKGIEKLFLKLKKSRVGRFFSVKEKRDGNVSKEFIVKEEDGKLKIDGTISDG